MFLLVLLGLILWVRRSKSVHKQQGPDSVPVVASKSLYDEVIRGSRRCCQCLLQVLVLPLEKQPGLRNTKKGYN